MREWCDVEDEDKTWKIGYIVERQSGNQQQVVRVRIDGHHPGFDTFYCGHSNMLYPVRTYTMGLNSYHHSSGSQEAPKPKVLRQPLKLDEIKLNYNRLTLISRMQNLIESNEENIRIFLRTELLVLTDKIVRTPFVLLNQIKMCDLWINKLFIGIVSFYIKLLDSSKKFIPLLMDKREPKYDDETLRRFEEQTARSSLKKPNASMILEKQTEQTSKAKSLFVAMYEFTIIVKMVIGSDKTSKSFFEDQSNLTVKSEGFVDCFIKSENGILPFRMYFKNLTSQTNLSKLDFKQIETIFGVIDLFLDLCDRSKGELFEPQFLTQTKSVVDEIVAFLTAFSEKEENLAKIKVKAETVSRLETLELKVKPKKGQSSLRSTIFTNRQTHKEKSEAASKKQSQQHSLKDQKSSESLEDLSKRVAQLEEMLGGVMPSAASSKNIVNSKKEHEEQLLPRTKNLGQEQFLASLTWALSCGDVQTCKKLVSWRQNLLRLGRIVGWQAALQIGMKTMKKAEISYQDIIEVNQQAIGKAMQQTSSQSPPGRGPRVQFSNPTSSTVHPETDQKRMI